MIRRIILLPAAALVIWAQNGLDVTQRMAQIRESIAQNQARLRQYSWVETTEMSLGGELKKRQQQDCWYAADGTLQKKPVGAPSEPKKPKGLKGKVAAKKAAELRDYLDRASSLMSRYVPPDPAQIKAAMQAGKAALDADNSGLASVVFSDFVKPNDRMTLVFDTSTKRLRSLQVASYLDNPGDAVSLTASFARLDDGTSYLETSELDGKAKEVKIKKTNFGYRKAVQ